MRSSANSLVILTMSNTDNQVPSYTMGTHKDVSIIDHKLIDHLHCMWLHAVNAAAVGQTLFQRVTSGVTAAQLSKSPGNRHVIDALDATSRAFKTYHPLCVSIYIHNASATTTRNALILFYNPSAIKSNYVPDQRGILVDEWKICKATKHWATET